MLQEWKYCHITKAHPASPLENKHFEINYTLGSVANFFSIIPLINYSTFKINVNPWVFFKCLFCKIHNFIN